MTRTQTRRRADWKRVPRVQNCECCSVFSWEKKKFDKFYQLYFSDTLRGSASEQYLLIEPSCFGGVRCLTCATFICHDCVVAVHKAINDDHPELDDPWVQATKHTSPGEILEIPVGHCCILRAPYHALKQEPPPVALLSTSAEAILAGANHYFQYDLAIGSTPPNCVDVFSLGSSGSNVAVTHAVFPIQVAVAVANGNHTIPKLNLTGPTVKVQSKYLTSLPTSFNKAFYRIKVVTITTTTTETPLLGKHDACL